MRTRCTIWSWSAWKSITVGGPEDFKTTRDFPFAGVYRRRRYHLRYSSTEAFSLAEMSEEITSAEPGAAA